MYNDTFITALFIILRISGAILFNPFLGRRNVPAIAKMGLAIAVGIGVLPALPTQSHNIDSIIVFSVIALKEFFIGFVTGFIMQLAMSVSSVAGEIIDMQLGLGMGKIYDAQTGASMAVTGTVYNLYFMLLFFLANGHLTIIKLITESCELFPVGSDFLNLKSGGSIVLIFGYILTLAVKLALPITAVEMLTEAGLGFMMRSVPGINIFAVGLQIKLAVGLLLTAATMPFTSKLMDNILGSMFLQIKDTLIQMLSP